MGTLSFVLLFTVFLSLLLPSLNAHDLRKIAEQLNNLIDVPKEIDSDNGEIELEALDGSLNPLIISKPIVFIKDPTKLNVDFQAKVESKKNHPLSPIRGGVVTNIQLANQAKSLQASLLNESKDSKESLSEEEWVKSSTRRNAVTEKNNKNATFHLYIPNIKDILKEKFAKASMQVGLDVDVMSKDIDENKIDALVVDNRSGRGRRNYIRLCKRLTDKSTSLMQKLRDKDCVILPKSEFDLESSMRNAKKDDTIRLVGLKIGTKNGRKNYKDSENGSNERLRSGMTDVVEGSDVSANYDESGMKVVDKFGTGLNIKMIDGRIANLLRDGKLSLSASTALKV